MKYKVIDKTAYQLHLINTNRFKTTMIRVNLKDELRKEEITHRNFLLDMLTYSTEKYKTRKELVAASQDLYAANVYSRGVRTGSFSSINFFLTYLNEKYTEEGMAERSIEFFSEILFSPNVSNKKFDSESFKIIKKNTEATLKSIKDNPARYSLIRMLENIADEPYSYREFGYSEDLAKIDEKNLYEYYQKVMTKSLVDIYVIGDFDVDEMEKLIDKYFPFDSIKRKKRNIIIEHQNYRRTPQVIKETEDLNQSKLSIGCKIKSMTERERNYTITLYNLLLGGTGDSKFFKNIREKHSLCYYMNSSVHKLDNLLLIRSGIDKRNFDKCLKLVKQEMKDMEKGNFTEEELENAKKTYITLLDEVYDNQEAIIETYVAKDLLNIGDIEERKKEIWSVQKEEIVAVSKKVKIDTVYLLEGDKENEEA